MSRSRRLVARLAVGALVAVFLVGLWKVNPTRGDGGGNASAAEPTPSASTSSSVDPSPSTAVAPVTHQHTSGPPPKPVPLRAGEHRMTLAMPSTYTPSAPYGQGTDDYRCFLLDPKLANDVWLTGSTVKPGNPDVVHHVILFRVPADQAAEARAKDASEPGQGWTCFGGTGLSGEFGNLDDADWLGAWAPGSPESVLHQGYGIPLDKGSMIVMQVHYNLLAGDEPDRSAVSLRWTPRSTPLTPLHTMLLPAPVELPCRPDHAQSPLCDRDASVADVKQRFGEDVGQTANLLHLLCGTPVVATDTTTCTRTINQGLTVIGAAGHMHLLGRWIKIVADQGTPQEKTLLDIPVWDFDNQGARPIKPVHLSPGDTVTVTCHHDQSLRDLLPALQGFPDKYVVWGEGTTDEMCLGMLQVAFDSEK